MSILLNPLFIVAVCVVFLIFLIIKLKVNTFLALILTSILAGLLLQIKPLELPKVISEGMGAQFGNLAIIFGMGAMIGKLLADAGGGYRIAQTLIHKFGRKYIQIAVILASFIIGIALFFEVGLVVLLPIIFIIAVELDIPLLELGIPMAASLNVMHAFIPPHPAPTAVAGIFHAELGPVILIGILVAIPTIIVAGPVFNFFLRKLNPGVYHKVKRIPGIGKAKKFDLKDTPSFAISLITALLPVLLIMVATIFKYVLPKDSFIYTIIEFIGDPEIAMIISLIFAIFSMGIWRHLKMEQIDQSLTSSIKEIAGMLFIIAGGGAFKQVLVAGGMATYVSSLFSHVSLSPLIAAWVVTAILRVSLGSSTVAGITAAGLTAPLIAQTGVNPVLMVLAVGAGSVFFDHVNDAGFWLIKEYFGLTLKETFLTWTSLTTILSITGLLAVLALAPFIH